MDFSSFNNYKYIYYTDAFFNHCEFHENVKKYMYVVQTNHGVHASDSILQ